MVEAMMLIADFIDSPTLTIVSGVIAVALFGWFWAAQPLTSRAKLSPSHVSVQPRLP
jgi:hypothetical protein